MFSMRMRWLAYSRIGRGGFSRTPSTRRSVPDEHLLLLSSINWGEVFSITWRLHGEEAALAAERQIQQLPIAIIPIDRDRATRAATLKQKHNLGYADSFAAELAIEKKASLVTADSEFARLGNTLSVYALPRHEK